MSVMSVRHSLALLFLSATLAACGFTLRGYGGSAMLPDSLQTLHVDASQGNIDTRNALQIQLRAGGATLTEDAPYTLWLGRERTEETIISLDSTARAGEYALTLIVPFELREGSRTVLGPEQINLQQNYQADPDSSIAKQQEADLILEEMRRDVARRIINRLQRFSPSQTATETEETESEETE